MAKLNLAGYSRFIPAIDRRSQDGYRILSYDGSAAVGYDESDEFVLTEPGFAATIATKRDAAKALRFYCEHADAPSMTWQVQVHCK